MIEKTPQGPSPVTSPRISAPGNVFSGVRSATVDRLQHTVRNHNGIPNNIAMGRAPTPVATASNEMAVRVTDFDPRPGHQPRMGMHMQVQNAPGSKVDTVADAIQRYLNIKPRREPTSDPLAEDSIARHPQQIIEGASRWDTAQTYQFAINGAKSYQFQPEIRRWGASLSADLVEPGLTGVAAPATREPQPGYISRPATGSAEVVFAAQNAMRDLKANQYTPHEPIVSTGAPNITDSPYFDPAFAAQNTMARLRELMDGPDAEYIKVGAGGYSDREYNNPATAYENAMTRIEDNLAPAVTLPELTVGAGGYSDQSANQPPVALAASMDQTHDTLLGKGTLASDDYEPPTLVAQKSVNDIMENMAGRPEPEIITVGEGDMLQSIHWQPKQAWISGTHESVNLIVSTPGGNLKEAQKTALNQAWLRAMHIMRQNENFSLATQVMGRQA